MIKRFNLLIRLIHINFILAKHGLDNVILTLHLLRPLRFLIYLNPWNWFRKPSYNRAFAVRQALEELGPIFVKFGQALSTRRDLIPDDIAAQLTMLQDNVKPFSSDIVVKILQETYSKPIHEVFSEFDEKPLASASIAQVHTGKLFSGEDIIVKVVRPNIRKTIKQDIALMYLLARLADKYWPDAKRLHPIDVVAEFEMTILDELNLMHEAANASQLRRNFEDSSLLYIPEIYWKYTRENVMVMERIYGIPILDTERLKQHNIDIKKLAERGVEIFFTQVFRDSFFHADMHPGNLFVSTENPEQPRYICVDFGIVGTLDNMDKRYLAENFHAFFNRDYHRVAQLHVDSGWVAFDTRVTEFERAIRTVCEPIFDKPLSEISCGQMLMRLFQTGRRFNMEIQPQLILLQKTLFAIEGLGRLLYPDLDLWVTAKPYLERWLKQQMGPKRLWERFQKELPMIIEHAPVMPTLIHGALEAHRTFHTRQQLSETKETQNYRYQPRPRSRAIISGMGLALVTTGLANIAVMHQLSLNVELLSQISYGFFGLGLAGLMFSAFSKK